MKIWLDDIREAPEGWTHVRSVQRAINTICFMDEEFEAISLDHDLGEYAVLGGDAIKLVLWMAKYDIWPTKMITFHTANPVGRANMIAVVNRYGPFDREAR